VFPALIALHQYTLCGFGEAHTYCFILLRLCVIKQWSVNVGRVRLVVRKVNLSIITSFHNLIRNTQEHHLSWCWLSGSAWPFGL